MFFINAFMRNHHVPCWILVCKPFQKLSSRHLPKRHRSYPLRPVHWAGQAKICIGKVPHFSGVWKKGPGGLVIRVNMLHYIFREKKTNNLLAVALSNPSLSYIDIILKLAERRIIGDCYHRMYVSQQKQDSRNMGMKCLWLEMIGPLDLRNTQLPMFTSTDSCKVGQIKGMFQLWCLLCWFMLIWV